MTSVTLTENGNSLQDFLSVSETDLSKGLTRDVLLDAARAENKELADWVKGTRWTAMPTELAHHLTGFLQGDPAGIFAGAWAKYSALKKCANESRTHPNDSTSAVLTNHDFTYEIKPTIDILLDGVKIGAFPFAITFTCEIDGIELQIKNGAIVSVRTGTADCTAEIACAASTIWHRDLARVDLPGKLHIKKPIAI